MKSYRFFFSYASANYKNAPCSSPRDSAYHLEQFYIDLCREVSDLCGEDSKKVGYLDRERLRVSDFWNEGLVEGLQNSSVLLALLSPHYLKSENCGREFEFFKRRLEGLQANSTESVRSHRIIPVFWMDTLACHKNVDRQIMDEIGALQFKDGQMPDRYPSMGLSQFCKLKGLEGYENLCNRIAKRIVELSDLEPLPKLDEKRGFRDLPTAFQQKKAGEVTVASGPTGTNVIYVVGNKQAMKKERLKTKGYGDSPQEWCPFVKDPGNTVEMATKEGHNLANQTDYQDRGLTEDLPQIIDKAKEQNSPVLLVLDHRSLAVPKFKELMGMYDQHNHEHVGLVTAGGKKAMEPDLQTVFKHKFGNQHKNHRWKVPKNRDGYINSVKDTLLDLKHNIQQKGSSKEIPLGQKAPGLSGPT